MILLTFLFFFQLGTSLAAEALNSTPQQWRQRSLNIQYDGDPDVLPIRSDESEFLVRFLHQVASRLNEMVSFFFFLSILKIKPNGSNPILSYCNFHYSIAAKCPASITTMGFGVV